jgi:Uma2 family endonuclease
MTAPSAPLPTPTPAMLMTAAEFTASCANVHAELVKGIVKEYPVPFPKHGIICFTIAQLVGNHVTQHALGRMATNDSWIKTGSNPDTVRGADVCFFSYDRLPRGMVPDGMLPVAPDLVIEVRSPTDRWNAVFAKVSEYLSAGVRVVVVLDPATSSASVYRMDELQQIFHNSDAMTLPDVLPGFSVVVSQLFE